MISPSSVAALILGLECASFSAACLLLLRPPFYDVLQAMLGPDAEDGLLRPLLSTGSLIAGGAAVLLFGRAL